MTDLPSTGTSIMASIERCTEDELDILRNTLLEVFTAPSTLLEEFAQVWEKIGLTPSQRQDRRKTMAVHVSNLLKDILREEVELEKSMMDSLQTNEAELTSLCVELDLPKEEISDDLSLYKKEKLVRHHVDALNKIKFERQKRLKRIKEMETSLCKELGEASQLRGGTHVPSEKDLKQYLNRVEGLEQDRVKRQKRYRDLKHRVQDVNAHLDMNLDKEYAVFSTSEATGKGFIYSVDNMNTLEQTFQKFEEHVREFERISLDLRQKIKSLWERLDIPDYEQQEILASAESFRPKDIKVLKKELERLNLLKKQHMETFISKTRDELRNIWKDCLFGIQQQREFAPAFVEDKFDDDLLSVHESELDRMRGFYQDNLEIFKLIKTREDTFQQYCALEDRDNDPAKYSNRGGRLLKDQAMKKQLKKELPKIEKELNTVLLQWEDDHERFFMVEDGRYLDTIKLQWDQKKEDKSNEKLKRHKEKETVTIMEMTYGSKPSTPVKRIMKRCAASPLAATVPNKLRRIDQSPIIRPTTGSGNRLPRSAVSGSRLPRSAARQPLSSNRTKSAKTPVRPSQRKIEQKRILGEQNSRLTPDDTFLSSGNFSLASTGSYTDFQHGMIQSADFHKNTRSTVLLPKSSSMENIS